MKSNMQQPLQPAPQVVNNEVEAPPILHLQGIGPVVARSCTIASVHFAECRNSFFHSNRKTYVLPAAPPGGISYLKFYDSVQNVPSWGSDFNAPPDFVPMPVSAESILSDLMQWAWVRTSREGIFRAGIGPIAGDTATEAEIAELRGREKAMCLAIVREADRLFQDGKRSEISQVHRSALDWLGGEKSRPWYIEIEIPATKPGVLSGRPIPMNALSDSGIDLLRWYSENPTIDPAEMGDPYISDLFLRKPELRKPKKATSA